MMCDKLEKVNIMSDTEITLGDMHFREANELVRAALETSDDVVLRDVYAQRYLGCAMGEGKRLAIYGTPGNDMASYMDGGQIEVFGSAQDQTGNTMNAGQIVVHGRCGDAAGYAMRGGHIYVRDGAGWRCGINMKQYGAHHPTIVIGGDAGAFLGEYMAGGTIVCMGEVGPYLASGMHGGAIFLRHALEANAVPEGLELTKVGADADAQNAEGEEGSAACAAAVSAEDIAQLTALLNAYYEFFGDELEGPRATPQDFYKLAPLSSRPYENMYA
jgi:glutamate synthase domain-containing protein 3